MPITATATTTASRQAPPRLSLLAALFATVAVCLLNLAAAQAAPRPLAGLLPGTTVAALHVGDLDELSSLREFWYDAFADADYQTIAPTIEKIVGMLDDKLLRSFGAGAGERHGFKERLREGVNADCPQLSDALAALEGPTIRHDDGRGMWHGKWQGAVIGVTLSRYNPLPGVVAVVRPTDADSWNEVYGALVYCYASDVSINQDGVELSVFSDGSDQPLVGATVNGTFIIATDVNLARASVRLANGANEPNHARSAIGLVAGEMVDEGVGFTVDFKALADGLQGLLAMVPGDEPAALVGKLTASLRTAGGLATNIRVDDAGLVLSSVLIVDDKHGEPELAELLLPSNRRLPAPDLVPAGAATLGVTALPIAAAVAWVDTWLAAAAPLLGEVTDVRSLARSQLGLDLDAALLDWLGDSLQMATFEVPSTDLLPYLLGQEGVLIVPVRSERAARAGLAEMTSFAKQGFTQLGGASGIDMGWDDLVAVTDESYRGVSYQRWRVGPLSDLAVALLDGQLVVANPASTITTVIDVSFGADSVLADARLGGLVPTPSAGLVAYELIDVPRTLRGLADLSDLLAAPIATGLRAAAREALESGTLQGASEEELPTFAELVALGDFVTDLLRTLAAKTGVVIGSSEVVGSALWTTYRLPLR